MPRLNASEVASLLTEYGRRSALKRGNPYRAKAYIRAAENLRALPEPLEWIVNEGKLQEIPGVGEAIADIVTKLHRTGSHPSLEKLRQEIPAGVLKMLVIPGLRPDKAIKIHSALGIDSLDELERAAREGRLAPIKGLGVALSARCFKALRCALGVPRQPAPATSYDKMAKLNGPAFDKMFASHMVQDHRKDIRQYQKAAKKQDAAGQYAQNSPSRIAEEPESRSGPRETERRSRLIMRARARNA
jgi:DNA polymerase/3'-5' exonuclease PolX